MRYTNLQLLQKVARAINSDEVETLDETLESLDILDIMERTLDDILSRRHWEFMKDKFMPAEANATTSVTVSLPAQVVRLQGVRHLEDDTVGRYREIHYCEPAEFTRRLMNNNAGDANTEEILVNGVKMWVRTDTPPQYYTSFDELTVIFDSYDSDLFAGIDPARVSLQGIMKPVFNFAVGSESVIAAIPEMMFSYWHWETIAVASSELRQMDNARAERSARRAYIRLLDLEPVTQKDGQGYPNYGRYSGSTHYKRIKRA